MIAFFRFLQARQVFLQLFFIGPSCAVNALQLFVVGIATPIGARNFSELEMVEKTRVGYVRAATHIDIFLMVVKPHRIYVRHIVDQF